MQPGNSEDILCTTLIKMNKISILFALSFLFFSSCSSAIRKEINATKYFVQCDSLNAIAYLSGSISIDSLWNNLPISFSLCNGFDTFFINRKTNICVGGSMPGGSFSQISNYDAIDEQKNPHFCNLDISIIDSKTDSGINLRYDIFWGTKGKKANSFSRNIFVSIDSAITDTFLSTGKLSISLKKKKL